MEASPTPLHELFASWGAEHAPVDGVLLPLRFGPAGPEYAACREGLALAEGGDRGWILARGADLRPWLQRILSSDLLALPPGGGQYSALLDAKGHYITELLLYAAGGGDGETLLLDLPASREEEMDRRLDLFHFGEDLAWERPRPARLLVLGPQAAAALEDQGLPVPRAAGDAPASRRDLAVAEAGEGLWVLQRPDRGEASWELCGPAGRIEPLAKALREAGAVPAGLVALDILRVEAGIPKWGVDFGPETTLPDSSQWQRASVQKGCYAGQEVVARVNTYGEAPWSLCRLRFREGREPLNGLPLHDAAGKPVGRVTSWVWSPVRDEPIGLGSLRRRVARTGEKVYALHPDGRPVEAVVEAPEKTLG